MLRPSLSALVGVARLFADEGDTEQAIELYALAPRYPFVANSRWFADIASKQMAIIASTLAAGVGTVARTHGQGLDLDAEVVDILAEL